MSSTVSDVSPKSKVPIERLDQSADVGQLDVRELTPLLVVEVVVDAPPREFESLADVLDGVDHHVELEEARFGDVAGQVRLEREVHLFENVVPRDVAPLAAYHTGSAPVFPDCPGRGTHHVDNGRDLHSKRSIVRLA